MSERGVILTIVCLHCSTNSAMSKTVITDLLLGPCLNTRRRQKSFGAASNVAISIVLDGCEACTEKGKADDTGTS